MLVLNWGKDQLDYVFKRQKAKFPEETIVSVGFNHNEIIGKARNFRNTPRGIICDVFLDDKKSEAFLSISETVAPVLKVDNILLGSGELKHVEGLELKGLSLVPVHADPRCQDNLKLAARSDNENQKENNLKGKRI